jgi:hypothetical protein
VIYLPPSALRVASIALRNPANRNKAIALTPEQFRYGFGNALPAQESTDLYQRWTVPSPGKPLFEAATANLSARSPAKVNTGNKTRGPLLVIAGPRPHRPGGDQQIDPQALSQVSCRHRPARVQRPGPLTGHRPRLARDRRRGAGVAHPARHVASAAGEITTAGAGTGR